MQNREAICNSSNLRGEISGGRVPLYDIIHSEDDKLKSRIESLDGLLNPMTVTVIGFSNQSKMFLT